MKAHSRLFVKLPKLSRDNRKLITPGLKDLFANELVPIIEQYSPEKWFDVEEDIRWHIFEGAFEECLHRIRLHIANKLNWDPKRMYSAKLKKKWINKDQQTIANIQLNIKSLNRLASDISRIAQLSEELSDCEEIYRTESRILNNLLLIPDDIRFNLFGTNNAHDILDAIIEIEEKADNFGDWLENKVKELVKDEMSLKNKSILAKRLRESYSDNAKKTLNNFIFNKETPECNIDENTLHEYFANSFRKEAMSFVPDLNGIFALNESFNDDSRQNFMDLITSKDLVNEVIKSRKYESAAGPDGIDYSVFKLIPNEASDFVICLMKACLHSGRVPHNWKKSVMRLIYKKNDPMDPGNWRPISISNSIYRIISCTWAKAINVINSNISIFSPNQRGFIAGVNGCADNSSIVTELFHDASRHNKNLVVTALDFRNAFGSVPHGMIDHTLRAKGFPLEFISLIDDLYSGSTTKIVTNKVSSEDIDVKIGTKQGCPVSPLLFNLCLEPLFEAITKINKNDGYTFRYGETTRSFHILAYADDILLISNSISGMENMLKTCERFCKYSRMVLAPSKSCSLGYLYQNRRRRGLSSSFYIDNEPIPIVSLEDSIRYLGSPIAARKISKVQNSTEIFLKFQEKAIKIFNSELLEVQKLHALRTFLIPTLDFSLLNGQLKAKHLSKLDGLIGKLINNMIGGAVPNAVKHGSWKDGGLSIPSLVEKADTGKIKSLIWMITNKDEHIKSLIHMAIDDERKYRKIEVESNPYDQHFFNWANNPKNESFGTNSIVQRARLALQKLELTLTCCNNDCFNENTEEDPEHYTLRSPSSDNLPSSWKLYDIVMKKEVIFSSAKNISLFLCNRRRDRWKSRMVNQSFHLHSMYSFSDSPINNEFLVRQQYPIQDSIFNFALRSRLNILPTPQFDEIINGKDHVFCPVCASQGNQCIQSLAHILNGCVGKFHEYTKRHNKVQEVICEFLKESGDIVEIHKDKTMHMDNLPQELSTLRPDIVAWNDGRTKCILVEIGVPYATHNMDCDKLEEVFNIKKNKYLPICNHLKNLGIKVEHYTVIVSSLGAVYSETLTELRSLTHGNRMAHKTLIKRLSMNAIIGSMDIWRSRYTKANSFHSRTFKEDVDVPHEGNDFPITNEEDIKDPLNHSDINSLPSSLQGDDDNESQEEYYENDSLSDLEDVEVAYHDDNSNQ